MDSGSRGRRVVDSAKMRARGYGYKGLFPGGLDG